jgi:hypothetical protein
MNANLYCMYKKRLLEEEQQQKKGLLQRGKEAVGGFVKNNVGKLAAGAGAAALVGGAMLLGKDGKKVTPEELQQQNMQLQQTLDDNLKLDIINLMHKAQTGGTPYSKKIVIATQPLSDNANQVNAKNQPKIKKDNGGIIDTVKGFVGL